MPFDAKLTEPTLQRLRPEEALELGTILSKGSLWAPGLGLLDSTSVSVVFEGLLEQRL